MSFDQPGALRDREPQPQPGRDEPKVYANHTRAFTPLSKAFITHAAMIPFAEKRDAGLYGSLFAKSDPARTRDISFLGGGNLMRGDWYDRGWHMERLRAGCPAFPLRPPRLFGRAQDRRFPCSGFFGKHLLEGATLMNQSGQPRRRIPDTVFHGRV